MYRIIARLLPLFLLCLFHPNNAGAQQGGQPLNLKLGDAVVTGFSGTVPSEPAQPGPRNRAPSDFTFINPDGPSVRVIDVSRPGYVWDGRLFAAPKTFDVFAKDVGQVFGVALDDSAPPNIYVAATSMFGLNIVVRGRDGLPERRKKGAPGAGWMKAQFGLDLQGGPGSIYKIDGRTGVPTLFANVTLNGVPNPGPGLGNLAYDSAHKQLFVSDLYTGMIHRFALDGKELGAFDHGVAGLGAAKLAAVPFNPANRPNIASDRFDSEKPETWGFAPVARRVWGLAVHEGRLYYSVVSGPQIWSVGIERDGSFAADPRWELDVPAQAGRLPVSDIAFSQKGAMILAQRALILGAYDYSAFTMPGEPQVFRVWLKGPNDPPSPGRWKLVPEEYAVGFAGSYRNTNGGVALGYGYGQDGMLQPGSCEAALWSTGQNLRNNPALKSQLEPGGQLLVHGLQGSPIDMVRGANEPPWTSYAVDYDDTFDDPSASGHLGSVRIFAQPCAGAVAISRPAVIASPAGGGGGGGGGPPPPGACYCPATPIPASGPTNYITNGNFATNSLAGWTPGGTWMTWPVTFKFWASPIYPRDPLPALSPLVPLAPVAGGAAWFFDDRAVNQSLSQSVTLPAGNYEVGFDLFVDKRGALNPNDATMSAVIAGVTVLPTVSASSIISAQTIGGVHTPKWVHYSAFFSTCGGTYTASFDFNSFGGPLGQGTAAKDFMVDRVYIIDSTTAGTNISCIGKLNIEKEVTTHGTLIPWPNPGPLFPMTLTCTAPPQSWSFSLAANGTYTATNIPFGKTCTVAEGPMPPFPPGLCPRGTVPAWLPAPFTTPASVVINGTTVTMVVHNSVTCEKPGELTVTKIVSPDPRGIGNTLPFAMTVTCTNPNTTYNLTIPGNTSSVPHNLPVGSQCTVTETQPPLPPGCTWLAPIFSPASVTIASGLNMETVTNGYTCRELPIDVGIEKTGGTTPYCPAPYYYFSIKVTNGPTPWAGTGNIVVTDTVPANISFGPISASNWSCNGLSPPAGTTFTCTYTGLALTANQVLPLIGIPATPTVGPPFPPYTNTASVSIPSGSGYVDTVPGNNSSTVTVAKPAGCGPSVITCEAPLVPGAIPGQCICGPDTQLVGTECVKKTTCEAPKVLGPNGQCICGPGYTPRGKECVKQPACEAPKVPGPDGQCICGPGYTPRGKECVKQTACEAPKVPGPAGQCICGRGYMPRGKDCVRETACVSPAKSNGRGGCDCPEGWSKQGSNKCVKRERKGVTGDDVRRGIDIIRGIPGSSGGGRDRGGRDTPSPGTR